MGRLPKIRHLHEFVALPDEVRALLAVSGCQATWSFTTGYWMIYEKSDGLVSPRHPLWNKRFEVVMPTANRGARWKAFLGAVQRIRTTDDCRTGDEPKLIRDGSDPK